MHIVRVVPLANTGLKRLDGFLSYFSTKPIEKGSIVEITLRGKILPALVIKNEDIKSQKLAIKRGAYNLKKVRSVSAPPGRIPVAVIKLCENLSRYYIAPIGQTLKLFIPSAIASAKDFPTTYKSAFNIIKP